MEKKYIYKTNRFKSKLELMAANNLTAEQYDTLLSMGRIQIVANEDFADFAGIHVPNRYEYKNNEYKCMKDVCMANSISKRAFSAMVKNGTIKKINNQKNVADYGNNISK